MKKFHLILFISFIAINFLPQQTDTVHYPWPVGNMNTQIGISGTFAEYRSTSEAGHYHNGTDIPAAADAPVYAVFPGVVAVAYDDGGTGYDSYVRVGSTINGQTKYLTYYHTRPIVTVGQSVAVGQQISRIAIDHVHLIDYRTGAGINTSHLNAIRSDGGLVPYVDTWKPKIRYVKFFRDNSDVLLSSQSLGGNVDIIVHIEEVNGTYSSAQNNGTYKLGYKILSADSSTVVHNPPDDGQRYKYYNKPGDSYVNINYYKPESSTSQHVYIVTNGSGASSVANTQTVTNNFWNADLLPHGNYVCMLFTEDVRGNSETLYVPIKTEEVDLIPPASPKLISIIKDSTNYFTIKWEAPNDADLKGYRLYYTLDGLSYILKDGESVLTNGITSQRYNFGLTSPLFFKLFAVDSAAIPNLSIQSDVYGLRMMNDGKRFLIVDGFDRFGGSGSYNNSYHDFVFKHAEVINFSYESTHHSAVENGSVNLLNYDFVIWFTGDESVDDESFTASEQNKIKQYLESGGKLFVNGSEVAFDLEGSTQSTLDDKAFLNNYLKAKFVSDDANLNFAFGKPSTTFANVGVSFGISSTGSPYVEDSPDVVDTIGGSYSVMSYGNNTNLSAGNFYTGNFGSSSNEGKVVFVSFPFETIASKDHRNSLMTAILKEMGFIEVDVDDNQEIPGGFLLHQNYPNPFNPTTNIKFATRGRQYATLQIFDVLGREIATLVNEEKPQGVYEVEFNASALPSGIYYYQLRVGTFVGTKKMILLR